MIYVISYLIFHIICGFFAFGRTYAHFQKEFPISAKFQRASDIAFAWKCAIAGPIGLLVSLILGKHGLLYPWQQDK